MNQKPDPNKVMLITGASKRIGAAIAKQAHERGYCVGIHYRSSEHAATTLVNSLNSARPDSAIKTQADFADNTVYSKLVESCLQKWGRLDVLINNASEFFPTPLGSIEIGQIERTFQANVYAPLLLTQAAMSELKKKNGSVINIVDIYASTVHPEHPVYCASKAALSMLTKSLAIECAPDVRVNGIAPGAILWPDGEGALSQESKERRLKLIPLDKTGSVEQIASAVLYLCGESAGFITGQILTLDGGRSL